jgi:hypothetical protein
MNKSKEDDTMDVGESQVAVKERKNIGPAKALSRQVREIMSARPVEHAGYLMAHLLASTEGLRVLAVAHGENMRTHIRFRKYHATDKSAGPSAPLKIMLEDVVSSIATYNVMLTVHASRPRTDAWSFSVSILPKYAPLTVVASKLHVRAKQALVSLMNGNAFDKKADRGLAWVKYVHFRYSDVLMAAYSPGAVLTAVLMNTLSADPATRARQMPLFAAVLTTHANDVEFRSRRVPEKLKDICARNVRHMQQAARLFSGSATEWKFSNGNKLLASMASECEQEVLKEIDRRLTVVR